MSRCEICSTLLRSDDEIEAGEGGRLMLDYYASSKETDGRDIFLLAPAIDGHKGEHAPFWPKGRCAFLTDDDLCELHDHGLKPFECRKAYHKDNDNHLKMRFEEIVRLWDTDEGRALVKEWKSKYLTGEDEQQGGNSLVDMLRVYGEELQ